MYIYSILIQDLAVRFLQLSVEGKYVLIPCLQANGTELKFSHALKLYYASIVMTLAQKSILLCDNTSFENCREFVLLSDPWHTNTEAVDWRGDWDDRAGRSPADQCQIGTTYQIPSGTLEISAVNHRISLSLYNGSSSSFPDQSQAKRIRTHW